jgi:hypothetical protein
MRSLPKLLQTVAVIVFVFAVVSATYEHFFSDKAKIIRVLNEQIKEKEKAIAALQASYAELERADSARLEEITQLTARLTALRQSINHNEVRIAQIKDSVLQIGAALEVIAGHTRDVLNRSRGVLGPSGERAGKRQAGLDPER